MARALACAILPALVCLFLTVAVTPSHPQIGPCANCHTNGEPGSTAPAPEADWRPSALVKQEGGKMEYRRQFGFPTEDECKAFLATPRALFELSQVAASALSDDPNAEFEDGEPTCVKSDVPIRTVAPPKGDSI